jgi:hypothetical protein
VTPGFANVSGDLRTMRYFLLSTLLGRTVADVNIVDTLHGQVELTPSSPAGFFFQGTFRPDQFTPKHGMEERVTRLAVAQAHRLLLKQPDQMIHRTVLESTIRPWNGDIGDTPYGGATNGMQAWAAQHGANLPPWTERRQDKACSKLIQRCIDGAPEGKEVEIAVVLARAAVPARVIVRVTKSAAFRRKRA